MGSLYLCVSDKGRGAVVYIVKVGRPEPQYKYISSFHASFCYISLRKLEDIFNSEQMKSLFLTTQFGSLMSAYLSGNLSPVSPAELFWQLRPFIPIHRIRLLDNGFAFLPKDYSERPDVPPEYEEVVYMGEVLSIMIRRNQAIMLLLNDGSLLLLSRVSFVRKRFKVYPQMYYMGNGIGKLFVFIRLCWSEVSMRFWMCFC